MALENFEGSLSRVLEHEGGFAHHPLDPGGATMRGVTQRVYTAWRASKGLPDRSVRLIEQAELRTIYDVNYWDAVRADRLPSGLDHVAFDAAVNSGPIRGAKWLQRGLGVQPDGVVGIATLAAARRSAGQAAAVRKACEARRSFLRGLKTFKTFGRGWMRRVAEVEAHGVALALLAAGVPVHTVAREMQGDGGRAQAKARTQTGTAGGAATAAGGSAAATDLAPSGWASAAVLVLALLLVLVAVIAWRRARAEREVSAAYAAKARELLNPGGDAAQSETAR